VVVAVSLVHVMQVAFHQIVSMAAVWNRFMTATTAMSMFAVVRSAAMARGAGGRIRAALVQSMLIHMSSVSAVKMAVVHIIDVAFMLDRGMSATPTMRMSVLIVCFVFVHFPNALLSGNKPDLQACVFRTGFAFHFRPREKEN
jgi:hypothetical protein